MNTATATHSDHQRTNVRWVILAFLFMASFVAYILRTNMSIAGKSKNPYLAHVLLLLSFRCTQLTEGAYRAAAIFVSGKHTSAGTGVMNTGGNVVGGIGALLVPIRAEAFGRAPALATGSVFAMIGVGLWLFVRADNPITFHST
jgi:hypothetical protein